MPYTYPYSFETKIGFDKIKEQLQANCISNLGRECVSEITFKTNPKVIRRLTGETAEFVVILNEFDDFPVSFYFDVREALEKARVDGTFLEVHEMFDLKRSLETIRGIVNFFKNKEEEQFPYLRKLSSGMMVFPYLIQRIDAIVTKLGSVKDTASPALTQIRREMLAQQSAVSRRMQSILKNAIKSGLVEQDTSVAIRDGRPVIPIVAGNKRKIKGIIHDESATGKTAYIEPTEIVELNNQIRELEHAEKREIVRILIEFTAGLRPYIDDLIQSYRLLGYFDFVRSKSILARDLDAINPAISNEPMMEWQDARHPLLMQTLRKEKKQVVPLSLRLEKEKRILLISGPNAGGKSVCLKTVGLLQYMFQCGLLVPVGETSKMGVFEGVYIDIGDEQSLENDLSTYSSHLMNMKFFVKNCNDKTLVLIDEFGTGTEPMLGGAIAESILNRLNELKTFGVITTHYTNLKHFASSSEGIINGAMLYDSHKMEPLFRLQIGKPGSSFAFEIARKIGLPEDLLQEASDKIGQDHIHFDKHLRDIVRDKRYWESKRKKIRQNEKRLEEMMANYQKELDETASLRKDVLRKAKEEAERLMGDANKQIENTIRQIKEAKAEKERTRAARQKLEDYKREQENRDLDEERKIARKIEKIKARGKKGVKKQEPKPEVKKKDIVARKKKEEFLVGDKVKLVGQGTVGEVVEVNAKSAVVAFGQLFSTVEHKRLILVSNNEAKKLERKHNKTMGKVNESLNNRRLNFKAEIDIRGKRLDEALQVVQEHMDNAIMLNVSEVRILHGTGNGILRQSIREYLRVEPMVKNMRDEHVQFGGAGITIVTLE
ncbi:endonuclease MutS2 [Prolixibacteraceae bacterium JC049]|nr:endonuclease MutS2 [Prolixibacteraceae bacterium JC049]